MDENDGLQQRIAHLGARYIQRTAGEIADLRNLLARARAGDAAAVQDIAQLAHKIFGSGSMFGFDAVSEEARALELAAHDVTDPGLLDKLQQHTDRLERQVEAARRARGLT